MRVVLAEPRGPCAGVARAVKIVETAIARFGSPVYVRKEIVHNRSIVARLRQLGAVFVEELSQVPEGAWVIFAAHGVAPAVREEARRRRLRTIDATCPLVTKVHSEVLRYAGQGHRLLLIGHEGHDEVVGTLGHAPGSLTLIPSVAAAEQFEVPAEQFEVTAERPLTVLTQTTLSLDDARAIMEVLRRRFPHVQTPPADDICYATQNRQNAVKLLVDAGANERPVDLLLVVGSQNSSNAQRLVEIGRARGLRGFLIDSADDLDPAWLETDEGGKRVEGVGVTSGASTPEELVAGVIARLVALGATEVLSVRAGEECVVFTLPAVLRASDASCVADETAEGL